MIDTRVLINNFLRGCSSGRRRRSGDIIAGLDSLRSGMPVPGFRCVQNPRKGLSPDRTTLQNQGGRCGAGGVRCRLESRPGGHPKVNKLALTLIGSVVAALALVGCDSNLSAHPTTSPTPSPTPPSWASSYTPAQIADYRAALAAFNTIESREAPIWANPSRYTRNQVGAIFRQDWSNTARPLHQFQSYVSNGIRVSGLPKVISSRPGAIASNSGGSGLEQIAIRQCVDGSTVKATQHGAPLKSGASERGVRLVEMFRTAGGQYLLFQVGEGAGSC